MARDARTYEGNLPVVAHPPCRAWGTMSHMAKPRPDEKDLAPWAVETVRRCGGVLEHPKRSKLWPHMGLPLIGGEPDSFVGWTLLVPQFWWGHKAEKETLLYIVGVPPRRLPPLGFQLGEATHVVAASGRRADGTRRADKRPEITKAEREHTHPEFARWLVDLALRCV